MRALVIIRLDNIRYFLLLFIFKIVISGLKNNGSTLAVRIPFTVMPTLGAKNTVTPGSTISSPVCSIRTS